MIFDQSRMVEAQANGICFVCRLCKKWHKGRERGLVDKLGYMKCASVNGCDGPVGGNDFPEYEGPLTGHMETYCHSCGSIASLVLEPKKNNAVRIGCCRSCLEKISSLVVSPKDRFIAVTTVERAGPEKFDRMV